MTKLEDFINTKEFKEDCSGKDFKSDFILSVANIDNVFTSLKRLGIKEVTVNSDTIRLIVLYVSNTAGQTKYGSDAIKTGEVYQFFGVKLILE